MMRERIALPPFARRSCRAAGQYRYQSIELVVGQSLQVGADQAEEEEQWIEQGWRRGHWSWAPPPVQRNE
eukprot:12100758-Alexandrium_andersonii.AAC.1